MNLKHIKLMSWDEAFSEWEKSEADLPHWIEHYKKRGFNSWREWRSDSLKPIDPPSLTWNLFEIEEPLKTVPKFYAGPFRAWKNKYYGDEDIITFEQLAANPELRNDQRINDIIEKFPNGSVLLGLINNSRVVIVDGLHRCCALAVANRKGMDLKAKLYIICAELPGELPVLGQTNSPT
jgi:hypothetical protein